MDARILYRYLHHSIPEEDRQEVTAHCGHCTAKLFLEGKTALDAPRAADAPQPADRPAAASSEPAAKRQRTARECVAELKELKELLDCGVLSQSQFLDLKRRVLEDE